MKNDTIDEMMLERYRANVIPEIQEIVSIDHCMIALTDTKKNSRQR